jgi:hypothetical protein
MQFMAFSNLDHLTIGKRSYLTVLWRVLSERQMGSLRR